MGLETNHTTQYSEQNKLKCCIEFRSNSIQNINRKMVINWLQNIAVILVSLNFNINPLK